MSELQKKLQTLDPQPSDKLYLSLCQQFDLVLRLDTHQRIKPRFSLKPLYILINVLLKYAHITAEFCGGNTDGSSLQSKATHHMSTMRVPKGPLRAAKRSGTRIRRAEYDFIRFGLC